MRYLSSVALSLAVFVSMVGANELGTNDPTAERAKSDVQKSLLNEATLLALSPERAIQNSMQMGAGTKSRQSLERILSNDVAYKKVYTRYLGSYKDAETQNTVLESISASFGVEPYRRNIVLPFTYDFKDHKDGRKQAETFFQISIKKDFLSDYLGYDENFGIAYTQRSWWQTSTHSTPFRETNYQPEIYATIPFGDDDSVFKWFKVAFMHESNGQAGKISRSWNRAYIEGLFQVKGLFIVPRAWYAVTKSKNNSDIEDYVGYGDLTLIYPYKTQAFQVKLRDNLDFDDNKFSFQAEWSFPIAKTGLFAYLMFYNGYGESLIDYDHRVKRIGLGVALNR